MNRFCPPPFFPFITRTHARFAAAFVFLLLSSGIVGPALHADSSTSAIDNPGPVVALPEFTVSSATEDEEDDYDATGMGAVDEELRDSVFANELTGIDFDSDPAIGDNVEIELDAAETDSPAERALGQSRLRLRGFPTPSLRNSFLRVGLPPAFNINKTIVIEGPLVPVLGRAAPGGIQNFLTRRPRAKPEHGLDFSASNRGRTRVAAQTTGPIVQKHSWQRLAAEWTRRDGPQDFTRDDRKSVNAAITWRHSRAASTLLGFDFTRIDAHVPPGIPSYRPSAHAKIAGPYLPLALFNANGPQAGVRRDQGVITLQSERQLNRIFALRASAEAWWGRTVQDRFTSAVLSLDTGLFEGVREPRHIEQPQTAFAAQIEFTARFRIAATEHKILFSAAQTWGEQSREERALSPAARAALPADVRTFDPWAPNYSAPAYDPDLYTRIIADRDERARYTAVETSDRVAFARGLVVLTAGLRYDAASLNVHDFRPAAARPEWQDDADRVSFHTGLNWQIRRNRALLFATASSAFDPSTRVDARTGRVQPHESTLGYETGLRGRIPAARLDYSLSGFLLYNRDIARRNPLYDDPIADPNQTQPQLVAEGAERYTGVRLDARWRLSPEWQLGARGVHMEAITTNSPDLPQEVGRVVARLPEDTASLMLRRRPVARASGWTSSAGLAYIGGYVANYEDARRERLDYPGYALVFGGAGYIWRWTQRSLECNLGVRNALDRDLLASNARVGAGREFTLSTRLMF